MNRGDGTFVERSEGLGVADTGLGTAVACFDYDRDGRLDIAIANNRGPLRLYRNELPRRSYLAVRLHGKAPNTQGIGARVTVHDGQRIQMRVIEAGGSYLSQVPAEAHFGLGDRPIVDQLEVRWPDGTSTLLTDIPANQLLTVRHPES